jgi:hypothetical protein
MGMTNPPFRVHVGLEPTHVGWPGEAIQPDTERSAMTEPRGSSSDRLGAERYELRLSGHLEARWAAWFDGMTLSHESEGITLLRGHVADQAALHGLLQKVRDTGLPLVSVTCIRHDQPSGPANKPSMGPTDPPEGD